MHHENPYESPRMGTAPNSESLPNAAYEPYSFLQTCLIIAAAAIVVVAAISGLFFGLML